MHGDLKHQSLLSVSSMCVFEGVGVRVNTNNIQLTITSVISSESAYAYTFSVLNFKRMQSEATELLSVM